MEFKVVVAGTRDFNNYKLLKKVLEKLLERKIAEGYEIVIVSGTCKGADLLSEQFAKEKDYRVDRFPADWSLGRKAGPIRNEKMAKHGDALIAFWDGISRGTKSMIDYMKKENKPYRVIYYKEVL